MPGENLVLSSTVQHRCKLSLDADSSLTLPRLTITAGQTVFLSVGFSFPDQLFYMSDRLLVSRAANPIL